MNIVRAARLAVAGSILLFASGGASAQRSDPVSALNLMERGQWQLRDASGRTQRLCITNPAVLLQIRHGRAQCEQFVLENAARSATVRYTCAGRGRGRTAIMIETPRLVQIDTQGVADGQPFSEQYEARMVGPCT